MLRVIFIVRALPNDMRNNPKLDVAGIVIIFMYKARDDKYFTISFNDKRFNKFLSTELNITQFVNHLFIFF